MNHSPHCWTKGIKHGFAILLVVLFLVPLIACGPRPQVITEPQIPGYKQLIEDLSSIDPSPLRGRLIMLDPGHGGIFRGALGPNGLAEADVNLGVALYLRGLLEWAGADVIMTRTTDRDFLTATDSTLVSDLAHRVALADSLQPDVFISLHHNSNPERDPQINETQTYYPLGDQGASLELAQAIHRHLALNLQITPAKILPGNFHVLRNATVPAVLGEPAMISNPVIAGRLSLASSQKLEAEAYFLGLLDYFAQGAPAWESAVGDTLLLTATGAPSSLSWTFVSDHRRRGQASNTAILPGPDSASFQVLFNNHPQAITLSPDGHTVSWSLPTPATAGVVQITGRNLAGRSTPKRSTLIVPDTDLPPTVTVFREASGRRALVLWQWPSYLTPIPGVISWPGGPTIHTDGHQSGGRLIALANSMDHQSTALWQTPNNAEGSAFPVVHKILPEPWQWRGVSGLPPSPQIDSASQQMPWRYRLGPPPPAIDPTVAALGFFALENDSLVWIEKAGLIPFFAANDSNRAIADFDPADPVWPAKLIAPDAWAKTIILDPRGGGTITDGQGPLGTRGSDLNLEIARLVAEYLQGAGAHAVITRSGGHRPEAPDKVLLAKEAQADLFLVIGRHLNGDRAWIRHYPGSTVGSAWAEASSQIRLRSGSAPQKLITGSGSDYLLRHTHCPALVMELPPIDDAATEIQLRSPATLRAEASAIALGILGQLSGLGADFPTVTVQEVLASLPGAPGRDQIRTAVWDGNFTLDLANNTAKAIGTATADSLTSLQTLWPAFGLNHQLEIHTANSWQIWVLTRDKQGWQGRMVQSGP